MGDGASLVVPQRLQVEGGYTLITSDGSVVAHDMGQLLMRYGMTGWLELRGGVGSYVIYKAPRENGYSGTTLGGKLAVWRGRNARLSTLITWGLSTGTGAYDNDDAWQSVALAFDASGSGPLSFSANLGHAVFYSESRSSQTLLTATGGLDVGSAVGLGFGYAGLYDEGPNRHYLEGMITYLSNRNVQLDVNWAYRVDRFGDGVRFGVGAARRF